MAKSKTVIYLSDINEEISELIKLAHKLRDEEKEFEKFLNSMSSYVFRSEAKLYSNFSYSYILPTIDSNLSYGDILKRIERLRRLVPSLINVILSRIVIDFKLSFRKKVQFLFKNLDDSHIAGLILNIKRTNISYLENQSENGIKKYYYSD